MAYFLLCHPVYCIPFTLAYMYKPCCWLISDFTATLHLLYWIFFSKEKEGVNYFYKFYVEDLRDVNSHNNIAVTAKFKVSTLSYNRLTDLRLL